MEYLISVGIPAVRLRGSSNQWEGTVEVAYGSGWGSVCGAEWTIKEADVVCFQLGYSGASRLAGNLEFGRGNGNVVLENVICQVSSYSYARIHILPPVSRVTSPT